MTSHDQVTAAPVLPVLSSFRDFGSTSDIRSILDVGKAIWLSSGSAAIFVALRNASVSPGDEVLVPAFHCPSMVLPIHNIGAMPVYYRITAELEVTLEEVRAKTSASTKALVVPHLFGRVQKLRPIREFCEHRKITLIEDCAHAFFGTSESLPIGSLGHYAIASPKKFFALSEGGLLVSGERNIDLSDVPSVGFRQALRTAFDILDLSVQAGHLSWAGPFVSGAKRIAGSSSAATVHDHEQQTPKDSGSDRALVTAAAATTQLAIRSYSYKRISEKRHDNFATIKAYVDTKHNMRVLDVLNEHVVPYMVPIILRNPNSQFAILKNRGLPMWRWEHSARGVCEVTDHYAEALIQLPCHQSLSKDELHRMFEIIASLD